MKNYYVFLLLASCLQPSIYAAGPQKNPFTATSHKTGNSTSQLQLMTIAEQDDEESEELFDELAPLDFKRYITRVSSRTHSAPAKLELANAHRSLPTQKDLTPEDYFFDFFKPFLVIEKIKFLRATLAEDVNFPIGSITNMGGIFKNTFLETIADDPHSNALPEITRVLSEALDKRNENYKEQLETFFKDNENRNHYAPQYEKFLNFKDCSFILEKLHLELIQRNSRPASKNTLQSRTSSASSSSSSSSSPLLGKPELHNTTSSPKKTISFHSNENIQQEKEFRTSLEELFIIHGKTPDDIENSCVLQNLKNHHQENFDNMARRAKTLAILRMDDAHRTRDFEQDVPLEDCFNTASGFLHKASGFRPIATDAMPEQPEQASPVTTPTSNLDILIKDYHLKKREKELAAREAALQKGHDASEDTSDNEYENTENRSDNGYESDEK